MKQAAHPRSRPHYDENDGFFVVLSGMWWMRTGEKFDPNNSVPPAGGTYVIHRANGIHYDGAKDGETMIQVWGIGPATAIAAEKRHAFRAPTAVLRHDGR